MATARHVYKGNIVFTPSGDELVTIPGGYIAVENGVVADVGKTPPEAFIGAPVTDFGDCLVMPGFTDIHLHAPQFENLGLGLDKELMPWLDTHTFPEEAKFADDAYAKSVYTRFVEELVAGGVTRAVIFGTVHQSATRILFDLVSKRGLGAYIGKVNMDRNCDKRLMENTEKSLADTLRFIAECGGNSRVKPILTPRFVPACSPALMTALGKLAREKRLPVQSHLSESVDEVELVRKLHPEAKHYAGVYDRFGLLEGEKTVMAHCVHNTDDEAALLRQKKVLVAHCPVSNMDLKSGVAPVKKYLEAGIAVGLGSDIAGGHTLFMPRVITAAVEASKLYSRFVTDEYGSLSLAEAFYLATKGGGAFFGKTGSFEPGYSFDAVVADDSGLRFVNERSLAERFQRFMYNGSKHDIIQTFAFGGALK